MQTMEEKWVKRWEGGGHFIELEVVQSPENSVSGALTVTSNLPAKDWPIGLNEQVPLSAEARCTEFQKAVEVWARRCKMTCA